jgi:hypothetical protein
VPLDLSNEALEQLRQSAKRREGSCVHEQRVST